MIESVTSSRNPLVVKLKSLKDKRGRDEMGLMLVEGEKMLAEALKCGLKPKYLLAVEDKIESIAPMFENTDAAIYLASENVMDAICDTVTPQGCACAYELPRGLSDDAASWPDLIVALDGVQDPGNVGTIWRTADAAGFGAMLLGANCADAYSPKVQRAAMGSGFRVPCRYEIDLAKRLMELKSHGCDIIVSSLDGEGIYSRGDISKKFALVVGSEAKGVSSAVDNQATVRLKLPMRGGAESLNAAVAAGVLMYELTRNIAGG